MPELPDITVYIEALEERITGRTLEKLRIGVPFVLRSVAPEPQRAEGRRVTRLARLGKRIAIGLEGDIFLVLHLMIAGRLRWMKPQAKLHRRSGLLALDFAHGALVMTEAGTRRRASLHVVDGEASLALHDPGGLDVLGADAAAFRAALLRERHTLKRALTDPRLFSGIGNTYSDEILHRARLSPFRMTDALDQDQTGRLLTACRDVLMEWTRRLRQERGTEFPEKVTAFREGMAVHGRFRKPCPDCGTAVQRIVHAENECNYCPLCQTGGRILADRALSRLLRDDWPSGLDELDARGLGLR